MAVNVPNKFQEKDIELAHLNLDFSTVDWTLLRDPFRDYKSIEDYMLVLQALRDPKNFDFVCKYILNIEPGVFQLVWLETLWKYAFPMLIGSRGMSKTFTMALYIMLKSLITQGSKLVITSASFRQAKYVFEYCEAIWNNAPVLRDLCGDNSGPRRGTDVWNFQIGKSTAKAIPIGSGEKIRGMRATCVLVEEFSSVPVEIFEVVLRGFTATASNPIENIKNLAKIQKMKDKGLWSPEMEKKIAGIHKPNQIILSGTASWDFSHFADYWKRYRAIITSKGNPEKLQGIFDRDENNKAIDYRDYAIIRVPYALLPDGMMEKKAVDNAKATMDEARFNNEFNAIFSKDSAGFFRRSLIESCVTKKPILLPSGAVQFAPRLYGDPTCEYIIGVDPASESDNFAIIVLEVWVDHIRVVYCWTTTRERHYKKFQDQKTNENNFYSYCARKIRNLMKTFNTKYISLDSQGGGISILEALHDSRLIEPGELPIFPLNREDPMQFDDKTKDYGYDDEPGLHVIEMVSMNKTDYVVEINHGLRKDLENKTILFPHIDGLSFTLAEIEDKERAERGDTLADAIYEIEELKEELSSITHTTTQTGKDKFETPAILLLNNKRGKLRKDRYSALVMANGLARRLYKYQTVQYAGTVGGFAKDCAERKDEGGKLYSGSAWFVEAANKSNVGSIPMVNTETSRNNIFSLPFSGPSEGRDYRADWF